MIAHVDIVDRTGSVTAQYVGLVTARVTMTARVTVSLRACLKGLSTRGYPRTRRISGPGTKHRYVHSSSSLKYNVKHCIVYPKDSRRMIISNQRQGVEQVLFGLSSKQTPAPQCLQRLQCRSRGVSCNGQPTPAQ